MTNSESTNIRDGGIPLKFSATTLLAPTEKMAIRCKIIEICNKLLGVKYVFGTEWTDLVKVPTELDCSELVEGVYKIAGLKIPDGSQNQFFSTKHTDNPLFGDLVFMGRGKNTTQIYHVGIVYDNTQIIEARAFDPDASFKTGCVILRPKTAWEKWKNFCGYRVHRDLERI